MRRFLAGGAIVLLIFLAATGSQSRWMRHTAVRSCMRLEFDRLAEEPSKRLRLTYDRSSSLLGPWAPAQIQVAAVSLPWEPCSVREVIEITDGRERSIDEYQLCGRADVREMLDDGASLSGEFSTFDENLERFVRSTSSMRIRSRVIVFDRGTSLIAGVEAERR